METYSEYIVNVGFNPSVCGDGDFDCGVEYRAKWDGLWEDGWWWVGCWCKCGSVQAIREPKGVVGDVVGHVCDDLNDHTPPLWAK